MTGWMRVTVGAGLLAGVWMAAAPALAQENLDAGKSGAQLYASNCAICHKSVQALDKSTGGLFGLESFLREHYTASREAAATIAAYLNSVGGGPAQHRPAKKLRGEKKNDAKPEKAKDEKKPDEKSGGAPSEKKPEKKAGGKTAALVPAALIPAAQRG